MMRWGYCLFLALLVLLPTRIGALDDEHDDVLQNESLGIYVANGESAGDDEDTTEKDIQTSTVPATSTTPLINRTMIRQPLECYECVLKPAKPLKTCLDPTKHRVPTVTCRSADDRCFTTVMSNKSKAVTLVRGCRSACVASSNTTCCEFDLCNNRTLPIPSPRAWSLANEAMALQPSVLFFVTVLLILQTVQGCHRIPL